jgi:hypothetical protein
MHECEGRQPGLPPNHPGFVAGLELVRRIKCAQMYLDLAARDGKDRRAAGGAEMAALELRRDTTMGDRSARIDRRCVKQRAMMLAAIHAVAERDPIRLSQGRDAQRPAEATAGDFSHLGFPLLALLRAYLGALAKLKRDASGAKAKTAPKRRCSRYPWEVWWSQGGSNSRPLECHSRGAAFSTSCFCSFSASGAQITL